MLTLGVDGSRGKSDDDDGNGGTHGGRIGWLIGGLDRFGLLGMSLWLPGRSRHFQPGAYAAVKHRSTILTFSEQLCSGADIA